VEFYGRGRIRIIHHLAMVATGIAVESTNEVESGSSTIWRWWLRKLEVKNYERRTVRDALAASLFCIDLEPIHKPAKS
jgi:hypothetical protein